MNNNMSAEHSASLPNKLSIPTIPLQQEGYYRSKLFTTSFTANPVVAAAGPLLSLLERLGISPSLPPINIIRDNIEHELKALHCRLNSRAYTEEFDAIAHYLLCATIDEFLGKNYLRLYEKAAEFKAFTPPSYDDHGPEKRFFDIVTFLKERPNQYLDLIELAYYCLIAGFEGVHYSQVDGRQKLDNLIEEIYQLIQQHRVNKPARLFTEPTLLSHLRPQTKKKSVYTLGAITFGLILSSLVISHFLLASKARDIQLEHMLTTKIDHE